MTVLHKSLRTSVVLSNVGEKAAPFGFGVGGSGEAQAGTAVAGSNRVACRAELSWDKTSRLSLSVGRGNTCDCECEAMMNPFIREPIKLPDSENNFTGFGSSKWGVAAACCHGSTSLGTGKAHSVQDGMGAGVRALRGWDRLRGSGWAVPVPA